MSEINNLENLPALNNSLKGIGFTSNQVIEMIALFLEKNSLEKCKEGERQIVYLFRDFYNDDTKMRDLVIQGFALSNTKPPHLTRQTRKPIIMSELIDQIKPLLETGDYEKIGVLFIKTFIDG